MAQMDEKMKCVSLQQLQEAVDKGLSYVCVSFQDDNEPIYLVFREKPTANEVSVFVRESLHIAYRDDLKLKWAVKSKLDK